MNKLSKDKRDKLILTCIAILGILGVLYTFVLGAQQDRLAALQNQITSTKDKLSKAERLARNAEMIENNLRQSKELLDARQQNMAPAGDPRFWFLTLLGKFRVDKRLESISFVQVTQPTIGPVGLLPEFPYDAANFQVQLSGEFHQFGKFLAELENSFPYFRVKDPWIGLPAQGMSTLRIVLPPGTVGEKVIVDMWIITLIKPGSS